MRCLECGVLFVGGAVGGVGGWLGKVLLSMVWRLWWSLVVGVGVHGLEI